MSLCWLGKKHKEGKNTDTEVLTLLFRHYDLHCISLGFPFLIIKWAPEEFPSTLCWSGLILPLGGRQTQSPRCLSFIHQKQWKIILQNLKVVILFLIESLNNPHSKVVLMFQLHWPHYILLQCLPFIECLLCTKAWYYAYHLLSAHCVQRHATTHYLQYLH